MSNKGGHMPNKPVKIIMLTGYLGAGKTTLLNILAALDKPTSLLTTAVSAPP